MLRPPRNDDAARAAAASPATGDSLAGLRRLARKYSPDQPRVPAGNPDGGQWTGEGGGTGGSGRLTAGPGGVSSFDHATGDPLVRSRTSFHPDGTRIASTVKDGGALAGGSERYTVIAAISNRGCFSPEIPRRLRLL